MAGRGVVVPAVPPASPPRTPSESRTAGKRSCHSPAGCRHLFDDMVAASVAAYNVYGVRPMNASSLVWTSASSGTWTRGPYWPLWRSTSSIGSMPRASPRTCRIERLVLAGGAGEIPAVQEHVTGVDHVDRLPERHATDVREIVLALGGVRVVEECLHGVGLGPPGADGVVVDRRTRRQRDPRRSLEEGREPLDEVTDDVAGDPALHRRGLVPCLRARRPRRSW